MNLHKSKHISVDVRKTNKKEKVEFIVAVVIIAIGIVVWSLWR